MRELFRSNDPTAIACASAMLEGEGITCFVMDVHMSSLEGSIGILPRRMMVPEVEFDRARRTLIDNGLDLFDS
ncbi:MAG: DUF2007 domain-containing protein [Rhodobacteraceae bacterium]|nr:DUF2007 domain-containing protein [Paracoccaceae bacterium]MCY4195590.1 DUF2007 domain-containing protein [Paracoccaceae bacterium]